MFTLHNFDEQHSDPLNKQMKEEEEEDDGSNTYKE